MTRHSRALPLAPLLALCCIAADDELPSYPRVDPDNPGGERLGDDDGADGFTGYPADPGQPSDPYYDTTAEHRPFSPNWTGAWLGGGLQSGWMRSRALWLDAPQSAITVMPYLQFSSINHIADLQLAYQHAFALADNDTVELGRDSLIASLHAHPSFLSIIGGTRGAYTIADWSVMFGPSAERIDVNLDGQKSSWWRAGWHVGTTFNTYLDSPHDGSSWWIGATYRYAVAGGDRDVAAIGRDPLREHNVQLRLTYRLHGNAGSGFEGPQAP